MRLAASLLFTAVALLGADSGNSAITRAQSLYNKTDYAGAVLALKQAPQDARTLELLGQCYFMQGDYKHATETLEKAISLDPNSSMIYTWLGRAYGRRAETSFPVTALGYAQKTKEYFEKAVQLDQKNGEAINDLFEFYVQAPALVGGGTEKAKGLIHLIGQIDPVEVHFAHARIAEEKKQFSEAESHYRKALALAPEQAGRIVDVAKFLAKHDRHEEADQLFDKAEKVAPNLPKILFARAQSNIRSQYKLEEAQGYLKRYLAAANLTPEDPSKAEAQKLLRKVQGT